MPSMVQWRIQVEEGLLCLEDDLSNFDGEISKKEMFQLHKLPWPVVSNKLLSLTQGRPVMIRRLQELDLSVSPSQPDTPKDGNCIMSSILDQLRFDPHQMSFAKSPQQLRMKILDFDDFDFDTFV